MLITNTVVFWLFIAVFLVLFLPTEKSIKLTSVINLNRTTVLLMLILTISLIIVYVAGLSVILYFGLAIFCLWGLIFGFLVDRRYPYILALTLLTTCPLLLIIELNRLAEFLAALSFFCLTLGVFKDILYDKIIDRESVD